MICRACMQTRRPEQCQEEDKQPSCFHATSRFDSKYPVASFTLLTDAYVRATVIKKRIEDPLGLGSSLKPNGYRNDGCFAVDEL
jgi:hypothetical protein